MCLTHHQFFKTCFKPTGIMLPTTTLSFIFPCSLSCLNRWSVFIMNKGYLYSSGYIEPVFLFKPIQDKTNVLFWILLYTELVSVFDLSSLESEASESIFMKPYPCLSPYLPPTFASTPPASALTGVDRPAALHQIFKYFYSNLDSEGEAHFPAYNVSQHTKNSWLFCVYQKLFNWVEKSQGGHNPLWSHREPWRYESKAPSQQSFGFH